MVAHENRVDAMPRHNARDGMDVVPPRAKRLDVECDGGAMAVRERDRGPRPREDERGGRKRRGRRWLGPTSVHLPGDLAFKNVKQFKIDDRPPKVKTPRQTPTTTTMRRINVTSFQDALPQLKDHLASVVIDEDSPAVLLKWTMVAMPLFLAAVNHLVTEADGVPAVPLWMKTLPPVTFASLTDDMFFYLAMNNVNA
ncbi:hypothetical protein As57867_012960, partial [Aphanomyces stellatus]